MHQDEISTRPNRKRDKSPSLLTPPSTRKRVFPPLPANPISFNAIICLLILALAVRLAYIDHPQQVVFDEVHFGKFASRYINGAFFMDVHPPLGFVVPEMLIFIVKC
jgi:dolichyl-phosphate-mannose-protein mannosyltransferase